MDKLLDEQSTTFNFSLNILSVHIYCSRVFVPKEDIRIMIHNLIKFAVEH